MEETENDLLKKRLNDLEQNIVPALKKALKDVEMEKDVVVVSREDLYTQLRALKRHLKEVEDEQFRAEEDATSLRAELNSMQQMTNHVVGTISAPGISSGDDKFLEIELNNLKYELQKDKALIAEGQSQIDVLLSTKHELENKLEVMSNKVSEAGASENGLFGWRDDKPRLEKQLHDMAITIERLEASRQKLLAEIDSQSSEIEKLFVENSDLLSSYEESMRTMAQWENQVQNCLRENEVLRSELDKLRSNSNNGLLGVLPPSDDGSDLYSDLKGRFVKEQSRADALSADVIRLSLNLQQTNAAYNHLSRLYKPALRSIESGLVKMSNDVIAS